MPKAEQERIATLLTPIDTVLKLEGVPAVDGDPGSILLTERITTVDRDGRRTIVLHSIYKTLTDAGVQTNADDITTYAKKDQSIHLLAAETIQADGTRQPVKPEAILIQSPQRQASYSLYDDEAELKLIFPNVKPGAIVRRAVVIKDLVPTIPGEFYQMMAWTSSWPIGLYQNQVILPNEMAARMKIAAIGNATPEPTVANLPDGMISYTWRVEKRPGAPYEINKPPSTQIGPSIHLSTIESWDKFAAWYRSLLKDRDQLGEPLAAQVDAWTAQAKSNAETIAILHNKVADDIRYVGLEFGTGAYQPHHCKEVWETQYGDCKDKANLLKAMLQRRGIQAHIALVNTDHLGLVERRTPGLSYFDHAIVAIPQKGGYLFCDPTRSFSDPGMLGSSSSDRDVLVIADHGADWAHTPAQTSGVVAYDFDLKLAPDGELSGWLTYRATGVYGATEHKRFSQLDHDDLSQTMSRIVRGFFKGAEIIDVTTPEFPSRTSCVVKAYFALDGKLIGSDGTATLKIPSSASLFDDLGTKADRRTVFFFARDTITATARIELPAGLIAKTHPAPFEFSSDTGSFRGSWSFEKGLCRTEISITTKQSAAAPDAFKTFYEGIQSFHTWISRPVVLESGKEQPKLKPTAKLEIDLPKMPTGNGQIALVDKRYPDAGDPDMRRAALERTLQYFPSDNETLFRAGVRIARIDWDAGRTKEAHERTSKLLQTHAGRIKPETYSWGDLNDALMLRDLKKTSEAIDRLEKIARDNRLTSSRRAGAAYEAADLLIENSPKKALALLLEVAGLPDGEGATDEVESRIAHLLLIAKKPDQLKQRLAQIMQTRPEPGEKLLTTLLNDAASWNLKDDAQRVDALAQIVESICSNPGEPLREALRARSLEKTCRSLQAELTKALSKKPLSAWYAPDAKDKSTTFADFKKRIDEADNKSDAAGGLRLYLRALGAGVTKADFPEWLWEAASHAEWAERRKTEPIEKNVCDTLLDFCDKLPVGQKYRYEGQFVRAKRFAAQGDSEKQQSILRAILATPDIRPNYASPACKDLGLSLEKAARWQDALDAFKKAEPFVTDYSTAADCQLHAALINLHLGRDDEAARVITILSKASKAVIDDTVSPQQIRELVKLVQDGGAAAYWQETRKWWPHWQRMSARADQGAGLDPATIPVIPDLSELGKEFGQAQHDRDTKTCLQVLTKLASAARWQPTLANDLAGLVSRGMQIVPNSAVEMRLQLIALLSISHPPGSDGLRNRQLFLAAHCVDAGQSAKSLETAKTFFATNQPNDAITQAMNQVFGYAALAAGRELEPAAKRLEADLGDAKNTLERADAVRVLADIYRRLNRSDDEEKLLDRALKNPAIASDEKEKSHLETRRTQLADIRRFSDRVAAWIQSVPLPWYKFAEPTNPDDPRLLKVDEVLRQTEFQGKLAEQAKLLLLASQSTRLPIDKRKQHLHHAVRILITLAPDYPQVLHLANSVLKVDAFDAEIRLQALWAALSVLAEDGRKAEYDLLRANPLCSQYGELYQKKLTVLDLQAALDTSSAESILKSTEKLTAGEISAAHLDALDNLFEKLLRRGDLAAAEKFASASATWSLATEIQKPNNLLQLDYLRRIENARPRNAVCEALATALLAHFPDASARLPDAYANLRSSKQLPTTTPPVTLQACLHQIKNRQYDRSDLQFWTTALRALPDDNRTEQIVGDMLKAAIPVADQDELRFELLLTFLVGLDFDEPAILARFEKETALCKNSPQMGLSYAMFRIFEINKIASTGEKFDLEKELADITDSRGQFMMHYVRLTYYLQQKDRPQLERTVAKLSTGTMFSTHFITSTLPALEFLQLKNELRVARDFATRELRSAIVNSWANNEADTAKRACKLAELLGDPSLIPDAWVADMTSRAGEVSVQHRIKLTKALLSKDWAKVESEAAILNRDYPTQYAFHRYRGLALHKLGRNQEAVAPLKTYIEYSKDELEYPETVELLQTIEKKLDPTETPKAR